MRLSLIFSPKCWKLPPKNTKDEPVFFLIWFPNILKTPPKNHQRWASFFHVSPPWTSSPPSPTRTRSPSWFSATRWHQVSSVPAGRWSSARSTARTPRGRNCWSWWATWRMRSRRIQDANSCAWGGDIWYLFFGKRIIFWCFSCFGFEGWCWDPEGWCGIVCLGHFYFYDLTWQFFGCDA